MPIRIHPKDLIKTFTIFTGDTVKVIAGKDRGKRGVIKEIARDKNRVVVEGLNLINTWVKNPDTSEMQLITREQLLHYSNVRLIDPATNKPAKGAVLRYTEDGKRVRLLKPTGTILPVPERPKREPYTGPDGPKDTPPEKVLERTYNPDEEIMFDPSRPRILPYRI